MQSRSQLISSNELQSMLDDPDLRIVDCRFELTDPDAGRASYLEAHIPGAVFADLDKDLAAPVTPASGRHPLPDRHDLAGTFGRLGIDDATDVVVYDGNSGALAARAWWLLRWLGHARVRLLDGGYDNWLETAGAIVAGEQHAAPRQFLAKPCMAKVATTAELLHRLEGTADMRLFDARDAARFRGEVEPIDAVAGHVPGARNVPFQSSLEDNGRWKSRDDLEILWGAILGGDEEHDWIVMCGSGVTACHLAVSAVEAGYREPRLYPGSWSEWIRDPRRPIGRGHGANPYSGPADMA